MTTPTTPPTPPTHTDLREACAIPEKGARAYARVRLESGLELSFIRTNGRRSEPLEAFYVGFGAEKLRIEQAQVETLLKLWAGAEIVTLR